MYSSDLMQCTGKGEVCMHANQSGAGVDKLVKLGGGGNGVVAISRFCGSHPAPIGADFAMPTTDQWSKKNRTVEIFGVK